MKELNELNFPDDVKYAESHEWARTEGDKVKVGISDYAQDQLGDIVFVELPEVGSAVAAESPFGVVESVKAVSDLFSPISGTVTEVNRALEDRPELINDAPYGDGWIIVIEASAPGEIDDLLSSQDYQDYIQQEQA